MNIPICGFSRLLAAPVLALALAFVVGQGPVRAEHLEQIVKWPITQGGNGHFYTLTSGPSSWSAAQAEAEALGGYLVSINDGAEQLFIVQSFLSGANSTSTLWIGLTDQDSEGVFEWVNGEPVTYTNWYPGEPNNFNIGEDFVVINWHFSQGSGVPGDWNDFPLAANQVGIIEMPLPTSVPGPSGLGLVVLMLLLAAFGYRKHRLSTQAGISSD